MYPPCPQGVLLSSVGTAVQRCVRWVDSHGLIAVARRMVTDVVMLLKGRNSLNRADDERFHHRFLLPVACIAVRLVWTSAYQGFMEVCWICPKRSYCIESEHFY